VERIQTSVHYPPIHRFTSYAGAGSLPVTDEIADRVLTLPLHPSLTLEQVDEVCDLLFQLVNGDGDVG
jgi:dTDP-4-amino-4,6-dideoxygalactose transaminase